MLGRTFGTLATIAVGANAFLLPPGINSIHSDSVSAIDNPSTQSIKLPCSDCVFPNVGRNKDVDVKAEESDDLFWAQGGARAVVLNFTLSDDKKAITMNGGQIYPVTTEKQQLTVPEVSAETSFADIKSHPEHVNPLAVSSAGILSTIEPISPAGDNLIKLTYKVLALQNQHVSIDAVEAKVLQDASGNLMIISVEEIPEGQSVFDFGSPVSHPSSAAEKQCNRLPPTLCKLKNMMESKIQGLKHDIPKKFGHGCSGRKGGPKKLPGHLRPPHFGHFDKPDHKDHHDHKDHPHFLIVPHRPQHHQPQFLHRALMAFVSVLVPVIAGITMGMFVSIIGMAVGRLIVFMWVSFRRGGQRGYASVAQDDAPTDDDALEKGVSDQVQEEPLPEYEAAPAYEEKEEQEK